MNTKHSIDVVQIWLKAVNNRDDEGVIGASDPDIEIVGPRGSGYGHQLLRDWLNHARVSLETFRTFARDDQVVVAQHAVWRSVETGELIGKADVASQFRVKGERVARYARYDNLDDALQAASLTGADEIPLDTLDLEAYFRRIGYAGPRTANLDTLKAIVLHHTASIPFENLNPFLRWPVRLDLESLQQKLVRDGRGGYCFEQNLLLSRVLQALGFQVTQLAARVMWNVPAGVITPRGHMLLRIDLNSDLNGDLKEKAHQSDNEQPYIVDVGFGGQTLTGVLRLQPDLEQPTPHEPFRFIRADQKRTGQETFMMQAKIRDAWQPLYRFDLQEQYLPDYEVTNWYLSNHPDSHFINGLIAARPDRERRYALRNNELAVHHLDGKTERRTLGSAAELRTALEEYFRITLPQAPELDAALQRLIEPATHNQE